MEELLAKHKQEKKELQANIQKMKQLVPKNDKKRRKEITQKIDEMELELKSRQEQEVYELDRKSNQLNEQSKKPVLEQLEQLQISLESNQMNFDQQSQSKPSKAQKRRERKEREQLEREQRVIEGEKDKENHIRIVEINEFDKLFKEHNFKLHDIPSDGDCMYGAIEHQLGLNAVHEHKVDDLRKLTADSLRKQKDDYLPFLTSSNQDELMSDQEFEQYCTDIEKTKKWGGNIELRILSNELKVNINVYQADGPIIKFECKNPIFKTPLLISYHKHLYQLGAHYNSLLRTN